MSSGDHPPLADLIQDLFRPGTRGSTTMTPTTAPTLPPAHAAAQQSLIDLAVAARTLTAEWSHPTPPVGPLLALWRAAQRYAAAHRASLREAHRPDDQQKGGPMDPS